MHSILTKCVPLFAPVLTAVQFLARRMSHTQYCLGSESYTVLIDLGLAELRNVRDSAAPQSYLDSLSQAFSDSWVRLHKARSYIG